MESFFKLWSRRGDKWSGSFELDGVNKVFRQLLKLYPSLGFGAAWACSPAVVVTGSEEDIAALMAERGNLRSLLSAEAIVYPLRIPTIRRGKEVGDASGFLVYWD